MPDPLDDTLPALFAVVDQSPVGMALLSADGRVVFENARLRALAGDDVWTGHEARRVDALSDEIRGAVRVLVDDGRPFEDVEGSLVRADGRRCVVASGVRLDGAGEAAFVLTVLDVTAARDGEAVLALHARVETAEAALRQAALAHPDELALLEVGTARIATALRADAGMAFVGDGSAFVRVAAAPPDALPNLTDLVAADWPDLRVGRARATDAFGGAALLLPVRGAAEAVLVLVRRVPFSAAETVAAERLAALFSTLWAWTEAEARFRRTVADLDDALFTVAYDDAGRRVYAFVTAQAEALTGLDPDALLAGDADWAERVHPDDREAFAAHDARLRAGEASRVDVRLRVGGKTVWVAERATPGVDALGRPVAGGLLQDISAQKAAEATLTRARRTAERAAQTRMAFLRLMSHELRTPLGAIRGFAELLREEVEALPDAPPEIAEFAGTIRESAERALRLVSDLLDLSRLETGALPLRAEPVDLHGVAAAAVAGQSASAVPVRLVGGSTVAVADPERTAQIVRQLVANAVQFTSEGEIEVQVSVGAGSARVAVRDTGVGIEDVVLESLFEPLVQADVRVNRDREGTGLGLAIASRLAGAMGGRIDVESVPGAGSTFTLVLPAAA